MCEAKGGLMKGSLHILILVVLIPSDLKDFDGLVAGGFWYKCELLYLGRFFRDYAVDYKSWI